MRTWQKSKTGQWEIADKSQQQTKEMISVTRMCSLLICFVSDNPAAVEKSNDEKKSNEEKKTPQKGR